jgi:hypothetical protein
MDVLMATTQQVIATTGPQVPHDRIRAHGYAPLTLPPLATALGSPTAGVCAAAHGWAEALLSDESRFAAAVLSTRCDQIRRTFETLRARTRLPLFLLNVPATHGTETARRLYAEELNRLDRFLSRLGEGPQGESLTGLGGTGSASATSTFGRCSAFGGFPQTAAGACRSASLAANGEASPLDRALRHAPDAAETVERAFRVGLLACCLTEADDAVLRMLPQVGLQIAVHATEGTVDTPTIAQRPNAPFFEWLRKTSRAAGLEGWVHVRQPWCDLYHAEVPRMKSATALPWLDLETGARPAFASLCMRAEAFAETLQACRAAARVPAEGLGR